MKHTKTPRKTILSLNWLLQQLFRVLLPILLYSEKSLDRSVILQQKLPAAKLSPVCTVYKQWLVTSGSNCGLRSTVKIQYTIPYFSYHSYQWRIQWGGEVSPPPPTPTFFPKPSFSLMLFFSAAVICWTTPPPWKSWVRSCLMLLSIYNIYVIILFLLWVQTLIGLSPSLIRETHHIIIYHYMNINWWLGSNTMTS